MTAHATATADTAGLEPAATRYADIVVDAGALPFKSYASCDSFLAGESDPVVGGQTPFADRGGQWFRGRTNPDCQSSAAYELDSSCRRRSFPSPALLRKQQTRYLSLVCWRRF